MVLLMLCFVQASEASTTEKWLAEKITLGLAPRSPLKKARTCPNMIKDLKNKAFEFVASDNAAIARPTPKQTGNKGPDNMKVHFKGIDFKKILKQERLSAAFMGQHILKLGGKNNI